MFFIRGLYYRLIDRLSEMPLIRNFTGFGLVRPRRDGQAPRDRRSLPYFRGLICDIGYERAEIPYMQPARKRGITKNNFYTLYDMAMLGITNHSKVPLRLATMAGFALSIVRCWCARLPGPQADVLGHLRPGPRAAGDRHVLLRRRAALLHRHPRRVHRRDPHAGLPPAAGDREGAHQLRLACDSVRTVRLETRAAWSTSRSRCSQEAW